jgi:hypothetical protein
MKYFNKTKRSRLKLVIYFGTIISGITALCAINQLEGSTSVGLGAIAAIITWYTQSETKRPSVK